MSKIGTQPINLPDGVSLEVSGSHLEIKGPKGERSRELPRGVGADIKDNVLTISVKGESKTLRSLHGTYRALIANDVEGVAEGWSKQLELVGTGFRAEVNGKTLNLTIGYSHPVIFEAPEGINFKVEKTIITVEGIDKELVGRMAANIRAARPPEPYKGKGIKYIDEIVRRKPGKAAAKATAAA